MAFDLSTAKPVSSGFDLSTAKPVDEQKKEATNDQNVFDATLETMETMARGAMGEIGGGLAGLATGVAETIRTGDPKAGALRGAETVESVRDVMAYQPEGERSQAQLETLAGVLEPVIDVAKIPAAGAVGAYEAFRPGGSLEAGVSAIEQAKAGEVGPIAGERVMEQTSSPLAATVAHITPTAIIEGLGLKGIKIAPSAAKKTADVIGDINIPQGAAKKEIARMISQGEIDPKTVGWDVVDGRVIRNPMELEAIKQGFDEGALAVVKASTQQEKNLMKRMLNEVKKGKRDKSYTGRATDVIGDAVQDRIKHLVVTNKKAGKAIDAEAKKLKGQTVEFEDVADGFLTRLEEDLGITFDDRLTPNFKESPVRNLASNKRVIKNITQRLQEIYESPDAQKLHRLKKMIDEEVSYGKAGEGIKGQTQSVLKGLRRSIDQRLDSNFPEYKTANEVYSDTITGIDSMQDFVGKKIDLTGDFTKARLGIMSQRVLTNYPSRAELLRVLKEVEDTSVRHGGSYNNSIPRLVTFAEEVEDRFKTTPERSFRGGVQKGTEAAIEAATPYGREMMVLRGVSKAMDKVSGVTDDTAFQAIEKVLEAK